MIIQIDPRIIPYGEHVQNYCKRRSERFPKGCPNYNKKETCPPNQPLIDEVLNFSKPIYIIYTEFDIGDFAKKMWKKHPEWTERQAYNCRYWQPRARKFQKKEEVKAVNELGLTKVVDSPEAHGVHLDFLMRKIGIELEWPPRKITRLVSLSGYSKY